MNPPKMKDPYFNIDALSNSAMSYLARSPAHYKAWRDGLLEQRSPAMAIGTAIHMAILEPDRFEKEYVSLPDTSFCATPGEKAAMTKAAKKASNFDSKPLSYADYQMVLGIRESALKNDFTRQLLQDPYARVEHPILWKDQLTGVDCKGKMDIYIQRAGIIADLKTTDNASPYAFKYSIRKYSLHRQAAFYLDGASCNQFFWIVVEKSPPYGLAVYEPDEDTIEAGRMAYQSLCQKFKECLDSNVWPGYEPKSQGISIINNSNAADAADDTTDLVW